MILHPAVVVHGMEDVRLALRPGRPVLLLSAAGAALFAGCGFWHALIRLANQEFPAAAVQNALDCADAAGMALAAIRIGLRTLVLYADAPGFASVAAIADQQGVRLLTSRPPALDLSVRGAARRLESWLTAPDPNIDSAARLR